MAQSSKQIQTQAQQQMQMLSPQQILLVKLLELPAVELEERVRGELLENPALEEGREEVHGEEYADVGEEGSSSPEDGGNTDYDSLSDYLSEDDIPDYKLQERNRSNEEQIAEIPFAEASSFYDLLQDQLRERNLTPRKREAAEYLIGSLDDDGFLRKPLQSISDELAIYVGIEMSVPEVEDLLRVIQDFDPAGVGARDLRECLLLQLHRKQKKHPTLLLDLEERIIVECYDDFARKNWDKIAERLNLPEEDFKQAIREICRLNPRPGASLGEVVGKSLQQIVPDFIVETEDDGTITFTLNERGVPELRMSNDFKQMVKEHSRKGADGSKESREALLFLKQKMEAAQGFIDAIRQRQHTLTATMRAVIELQRPFFLEGDEQLLKPMILKDVAEAAGLDVSTVSRVSTSKYVQTNFGIYPLKFFFSDSYTNEEGEELSIRLIQQAVRECVGSENKETPLTDDELRERLAEKGFPMARRTVAKYRQQLGIPVARMRRHSEM